MIILSGLPSLTWCDLGVVNTAQAATPLPKPPEGKPDQTLEPLYAVKLPMPLRGISINKDHTVLMAGHIGANGELDEINLWNISDNSLLRTLSPSKSLAPAKFSPDGKHIFAGAFEGIGVPGFPRYGRISAIWRVEDGALLGEYDLLTNNYAFNPDGSILLIQKGFNAELYEFPDSRTGSQSHREVGLWRVSNGERILTVKVKSSGFFGGDVNSIGISPDNTLLATANKDGIDVWQISDGTLITRIGQKYEGKGPHYFPRFLFFSQDNQRIFTGYNGFFEKTKMLAASNLVWQVADGALLSEYQGGF
jgi:WD40 repeat protein